MPPAEREAIIGLCQYIDGGGGTNLKVHPAQDVSGHLGSPKMSTCQKHLAGNWRWSFLPLFSFFFFVPGLKIIVRTVSQYYVSLWAYTGTLWQSLPKSNTYTVQADKT